MRQQGLIGAICVEDVFGDAGAFENGVEAVLKDKFRTTHF